ncbi:hypothetical protein U5817_09005 [Aromatoleum evansii]|uniref:NnrS family protein n=1 Tax=Aromatoleum evansii TaxID=59406 RepID=A0ABZ1ASV3_AROEV|nr:hypothetical protein U5817_09005 [Aromatoleum evansii]
MLGMLSLVLGVGAGLARLGTDVPTPAAALAGWHAALMICAFFGTVIGLERAVALGRAIAYLGPLVSGIGGVALLAGLPLPWAQSLFVLASCVLVGGAIAVVRRQSALFTRTLAVGAGCWLAGNLAWAASGSIQTAIPWWLAFLVVTIAGERLELTRFLPARREAAPLFRIAIATTLGGAVAAWFSSYGLVLFAAGLLALSLWLLRYDIARHNARQRGLVRYIALCLLSGYAWLAAGALIGLAGGFAPGHPLRDAALHAIALGFVFAMVFGHAPIIFPAIARVRIPYHPVFYLPLVLLHLSLVVRIAGGIGGGEAGALLRIGGMANAFALLLFVLTMVGSVLRGRGAGRG